MDLKTLKTFQLIATYGSFQRAAEELNYAQSTVSMQIQKLESDLGVQLIERGKKIQLTESGRLLQEQSRQIIKDFEGLQTSLSDMKIGESGTVRIGVTEPSASYRFPRILKSFLAQHPKIRVSVDIASTAVLSERLLRGDLDLALCSAPDLSENLYYEPLYKEEFVLVMPEEHPLSRQTSISPEVLQGHRLLITSSSCPYRRKLEILMQETGRTPLETMEIGSMSALKYYVEQGLGVALVPKIVLNPTPSGTVIRTMSDHRLDMACGIVIRASDYPLKLANLKLYHFLKQELKTH